MSLITALYPHTHGIAYNVSRRDYPVIGGVKTEQGILIRREYKTLMRTQKSMTRIVLPALGLILCAITEVATPGLVTAAQSSDPPAMKPMLIATESEIVRFNQRGEIVWRTPSGVARDVWRLEDGNVLFPFNQNGSCGVREVAPSGKTVWEYKIPGQYVISCQRLKDGNTLVGASCRGRVLVVSPEGKIVHSIAVRDDHKKHSTTIVRQVPSGNILVVEESANYVTEYTLDGDIVWEFQPPFRPFGVHRSKSGNTLISGKDGIVEVTPEKKIVWRLTREDVQEMGPRWFAGFRVLQSGNIMICNAGGIVPLFEVNSEKQVVWHTTLTKARIGTAHGLYVLPE